MTSPTQVLKSVGPKLVPFFKSVAVYFVLLPEGASVWAAAVKCAPVLSLMFFVLLHGVGRHDEYAYSRRVLVGLCWSCIGDALLVWPQHFLTGMAAFGVAQCAYISAFRFRPLRPRLGVAVYLATLLACRQLTASLSMPLAAAVPLYALLLATMAWRATARLQLHARWTWTELCSCVGGACFLLSDAVLGFHTFRAPLLHAQVLIMSSYYLAQLCIALSVVDSISEYRLSQERKCRRDGDAAHAPAAAVGEGEGEAGAERGAARRKSTLNTAAC